MPIQWIPGSGWQANSYITGGMLIDAGVLPMALERFRNTIETIILTHGHFDHTAHLAEIQAMTGAEVCIHKEDEIALRSEVESLSFNFGGHPPMMIPDRILSDGDRIGELLVIHTPGHTRGSICLYHEEERALISGDTVFPHGSFGRTDFPGGNTDDLRASIERLIPLDIDALYPGHDQPVTEGAKKHLLATQHCLRSYYG
ncbi:MBL fold metallo-hydrolase [Methanocalculus taiwanensis]|uniref:MBL fold metallo-hydrolase n=1 Tax=Methanocalculus taiwanensis TaxID=106207 RepID=A0ABD4TMZ4_9EURY|nr:MBL fold metallo-hydrolase [Methanocalculus taiwanensis]MCQ1539215.1 MBL fold metallo-hydrolase [Methanocalculus taiwanensis]